MANANAMERRRIRNAATSIPLPILWLLTELHSTSSPLSYSNPSDRYLYKSDRIRSEPPCPTAYSTRLSPAKTRPGRGATVDLLLDAIEKCTCQINDEVAASQRKTNVLFGFFGRFINFFFLLGFIVLILSLSLTCLLDNMSNEINSLFYIKLN